MEAEGRRRRVGTSARARKREEEKRPGWESWDHGMQGGTMMTEGSKDAMGRNSEASSVPRPRLDRSIGW